MPISSELNAEILECLRRSGYLLESRLVRSLSEAGYFVEPNVAIVDPRTGKSREIDLLAEHFALHSTRPKISVRTLFVIEAINNSLPLVLMTPHPGSPTENFESYLRYGTTPYPCPFLEGIDLYDETEILDAPRYSQYCGLTRKKSGEALMASHPDDLYASLSKLADYLEHQVAEFESRDWGPGDEYWRLWFWQAVLVVGGDLLTAMEAPDGELSLAEINSGLLVFNFHTADEPKTVLVHIVREGHLLSHVKRFAAIEARLAPHLHSVRSTLSGDAT